SLHAEREAKQLEFSKKQEICKLEAEEAARRAQCEADEKIRRIRNEAELTRCRQELEDRQIMTEIIKTEAEMNALEGAPSRSDNGDLINKYMYTQEDRVRDINRNPLENRTINQRPAETRQSERDLTGLVQTLTDSVNRNRLPAPEPPVFSGEVLQYPAWKAAFAALIDSKNIPPSERIHYLKGYLSGEAKETVEGMFYFDTEEAYASARTVLDERYGNKFLVSEAFRTKLSSWPKINGGDGKGLRKLADFLRQCSLAMDHISTLKILDDCHENQRILCKLPDWLTRRWGRIVATSKDTYPSFKDFASFVAREADIACNPIMSQNFGSKEFQKKLPEKSTRRPARVSVLASEATKPAEVKLCIFCDKPNHNVDNCRAFGGKTP
ncbi:PREDICTED: uncharacterized protein LOC106819996, partial [Priapulus caudatus]|uniref:Uncharacterized protein LOC106819996 n=1 Tax=Priapulus caudatus TaxID=37621 RepID=A0ABM1F6H6_PRICU